MSIEELQNRVRELEEEVSQLKKNEGNVGREKIAQMSGEVVDTNPYR